MGKSKLGRQRKDRIDPWDKRAGETDLQWRSRVARMRDELRNLDEPLVTPEAEQHGTYRNEFVTHLESNTKLQTKVNRGGDAIARWIAQDRLSQTQQAAIGACIRLWSKAGLKQRVTANYSPVQIPGAADWSELRASDEIEARKLLYRFQAYVPNPYWMIFELVCRDGEPAGLAGSRLGYGDRTGTERAHTVVCFVADVIAMKEGM